MRFQRMLGVALASIVAAAGCAGSDETAETTDAVVKVSDTDVKNQNNLGTCWVYATVGWVESLVMHSNKGAQAHFSETYLIYWDWFEKLTTEPLDGKPWIVEGGSWARGVELIYRYGLMKDAAILGSRNVKAVQDNARARMQAEIATGSLSTDAARKNPRLVRATLNRAFGFDSNGVADHLDQVFGEGVIATRLDTSYERAKLPAGLPMWRARDIALRLPSGAKEVVDGTLADAIGVSADAKPTNNTPMKGFEWRRNVDPTGDKERLGSKNLAWNVATILDEGPRAQRDYLKRVQRALGFGVELPITWAIGDYQDTSKPEVTYAGKRDHYGLHATLISDYEVTNVPNYGTIKVNQNASPEALAAALSDGARVRLFSVKNSWGRDAGASGYYNLHIDYLTTPVDHCEKADGAIVDATCKSRMPLRTIVLPPGY